MFEDPKKPILGCIADDFTGASDLASFLVNSGMRTLQINKIPSALTDEFVGYDAFVVALKTRTTDSAYAVEKSLEALSWLQEAGCKKFYFKYCSTFDSTAKGNIGPVIDALLDALKQSSTIVCPSLPVNGRTVYKGNLFVDGKLLNESPLKDHPLTPMLDASVVRLIDAQGQGKAVNIPYECIESGEESLRQSLTEAAMHYRYLVVDALSTKHLESIGHAVEQFRLVTGGSGLATDLVVEFERHGFKRKQGKDSVASLQGPVLVVSGSCSAMTRQQVQNYQQNHPSLFIDPFKLLSNEQRFEDIFDWVDKHRLQAPIVYTTSTKEQVDKVQQTIGFEQSQYLLENMLAKLCVESVKAGFNNIIVAGGETSGAVVKALNINAFEIGRSVTPGVPILRTIKGNPINLALKSGNFGDEAFFTKALETLTCI